MRFTFKQLRYYDAALRTGSIARAAEEMNISQSSITAAIDMIEASLGSPLFRRIPAKGIVPTETGRDAGRRIASFLEQCRLFDSDLMSLEGAPSGTLRLACYAPTAPHVLPPILKRIAEKYPSVRLDIKEGDMQEISDLVRSGAVDMALTYDALLPATQPFQPLFRARPFALIPEAWPLASQPSVSVADLAGMPMIMLDLAGTQRYFRQLFEAQGLRPNVVHTTKSSSVLRGLIAANLGYSILNIFGSNDRDAGAGYVAIPMSGALDEPNFGIAYSQAGQRSTILQAVISVSGELTASGRFDRLTLRPSEGHSTTQCT